MYARYLSFISLMAALLILSACNLSKTVDIELPEYAPQPVVECYLEPGKPFRLLLTRSYAFFDPLGLDSTFLEKLFLDGATVNISYNGDTVSLPNVVSIEPNPIKVFNYTANRIVPPTPGIEYTLNIVLPNGQQINSSAIMLPKVRWDSIVIERSPSDTGLYRCLAYMTDDTTLVNYYRRIFSINRLDTVPEQDFLVDDRLNETGVFAFGSAYQLKYRYEAFNTIVHLSKAHADFIESVQLAVAGNSNPFQQPSPIKGNVRGSANPIGIFTPLVYDRRRTIVDLE